MPRQLALFFYVLIVIYLFWMDRKKNEGVSKAIWIPFLWMLPSAARDYSFWFSYFLGIGSSSEVLEGNSLDRAIQIILMIAAVYVLSKRNISRNMIFRENIWIWLFFLFGATSLLWSDYPFVSFKRLIKSIGGLMMVMVILSEKLPYEALWVLIKRIAFLVIPLSVLSIKYYPEIGRRFHMGEPMYRGISGTKNSLGQTCLIVGIFLSWKLLLSFLKGKKQVEFIHFSVFFILIPLTVWLFYMADSATSLICMLIASGIFILAGSPSVSAIPRRIIFITFGIIILYGILDMLFNVKDSIVLMLGRRHDLTTRVPMWEDLLDMVKNPIIGFGYESFWLGDRLTYIFETWGIGSQAHNGYIEMYLNLGLVGIIFLVLWFISGLKKIMRYIEIDYFGGVLRFCLILVIALYNYAEATFFGAQNMWLLFFIAIMDPLKHFETNTQTPPDHDIKPYHE